jgi:Bacterial Ig-like domain (group 3)
LSSERSDGRGLGSGPGSRPIAVEAGRLALRALRHSWPALLVISFLTVLVGGLADMAAAEFARLALPAEFGWVHGNFPSHQYSILGIESGAAQSILEGAAFALGFGATAIVAATALSRERLSALGALGHSGTRILTLTATYLAFGVAAIVLAVVSVPLLLLAPIGVPVAMAGLVLWIVRPGRRRLARWMITLGVPFGLLVDWAVLFSVSLPAVAIDGESPLSSLRTSRRLVGGRWLQVALTLVGAGVAVTAVTLGSGLLVTAAAALANPHQAASTPSWMTALFLFVSVAVSQVPAVVLSALYVLLRDNPGLGGAAAQPAAPRLRPALGLGTATFMRRAGRSISIATLTAVLAASLSPAGGSAVFAASATPAPGVSTSPSPAPSATPTPTPAPSATPAPSPAPTPRRFSPLSLVVSNLNASGAGSLADAVAQANASLSPPTTITFSVSGTITLASTLNLTGAATIDGSGQTVVISGGDAVPVMTTGFNTVTITDLTIAHGLATAGSGLAGGFTSGGGSATFTGVTFDSNNGDTAGGLYNRGLTVITDSTFYNNTAGNGGGALNAAESVQATNDTFVLNSGTGPLPTGGAIWVTGSLTANAITVIRSSGGGIDYQSSYLSLQNSLLSGNGNGDCFGFTLAVSAGNTDSDNSCGGGSLAGVSFDQNLGSHGGPTQTIALQPGSWAVGAGNSATCPATDQRGVARPVGACDSGAYQFQPDVNVAFNTDAATYNFSQNVVMTATVTPVYESSLVQLIQPTDVVFYDGSTPLGSGSISGNQAFFADSSLPIGPHSLTAHYGGFTRGWSATVSAPVNITVLGSLSTITVSSSLNPSTNGDSVTFTANLTSAPALSATGTISFLDGSTVLATPAVASDTATFTTSSLAVGHHSITAYYGGDSTHGTATSSVLDQNVRDTTTTVATVASPQIYGNAVVSVTVTSPTGIPSGIFSCNFGSNGTSGSLDVTGHGTCSGASFAPGSGNVTVSYGGDDGHDPSSTTVPLTVTAASTGQLLASSPASPVFGQPVALTATVTSVGTSAIATGSINFQQAGVTFATVALDGSGVASTVVSQPPLGSTTYTSVYVPATGFNATSDGSTIVAVTAAPTTTVLSAVPTASAFGQSVSLTATVSVGGGSVATPTGSVLFADGAGYTQTVALSAAGAGTATAVASPTTLAVGAHPITATLLPNAGFAVSASGTSTVTVSIAGTTTALVVSPLPYAAYGQAVTLTATVSANAPAGGVPSGTAEFFDGATDLGGVPLDGSGVAAMTISLPSVATHDWSAHYGGTASYGASNSSTVAYTVYAVPTQLTASASGTFVYGSPVTISAHVVAIPATPVTGPVTFTALPSNVLLGTANVDGSGNASITSTTVPGDTTDIFVVFSATTQFQASGHDVLVTMTRATPTISLNVAPNPGAVVFGTVTLTATLSGISPTDVPQGGVTSYIDYSPLAGTDFPDSTGLVTRTIVSPSEGPHTFTISYAGNRDYAPLADGVGGFVNFYVNGANPGLSLASSPDPAGIGVPFTLTATVTPSNGQTPQGSVQFFANSGGLVGLGSATLVNGVASVSNVTWPVAATLNLQAVYTPSDNYFASSTANHSLVVEQLPTTTQVYVNSTPPWIANQPLTLLAAMSSTAPVSGGTVQFKDGTTLLGVATVSAGIATLNISGLAAGNQPLTGVYSGWTGFAGSTSPIDNVSIAAHPSVVTVTPSPVSPAVNQTDVLTINVSASDGYTGSYPTGVTTVSDGTQSCVMGGTGGACLMHWSTIGVKTVTATFAGDALFAPATATVYITVTLVTPTLTAEVVPGARWVTGETVPIEWSMYDSPAPTGTVSVTNGLGQGCLNQPISGTCNVPVLAAGAEVVTVSYSGDSQYASTSVPVNGVALACHSFYAFGTPSTFGTLSVFPAPDCNHGFGFADGDQVLVIPQPTAHHQFTSFDGYPTSTTLLDLTITQDTYIVGRFGWICDTVNVDYVSGAQWYWVTNPDCGTWSQDPVTHTVFLPYHDGESVTLQGEDFTYADRGPYNFNGWRIYNGAYSAGKTFTFTVTPYMDVIPDVVRPCYQIAINYNDPSGGTVSPHVQYGAYGCTRPDGSGGFYYGTSVYFTTHENVTEAYYTQGGVRYPNGITNPSYLLTGMTLTGTDAAAGLNNLVVHGDNAISVTFAQCHAVTTDTDPAYPVFVHNLPVRPGSVAVSGTTCHDVNGGPAYGWYAGPVTVSATAGSGFQFYTWHGDTSSGLSPALSPTGGPATVTVDGKADHHLTATFGKPDSCYPVPLDLGGQTFSYANLGPGWAGKVPTSSYGSIDVYATTPEFTSGHGYCPPQYYEAGSVISVNLNPGPGIFTGFMGRSILLNKDGTVNNVTTNLTGPLDQDGNPLAGSDIYRPNEQLNFILPAAGGGRVVGLQVWFCYPVNLGQAALTPNGTNFAPTVPLVGFDASSDPNACPVAPGTYLPGSTVTASEHPQPGYTFKNWTGSLSSTSSSVSAVVNGPLDLTAVFNGACYKLSVDDVYSSSSPGPADAIRSDDPNCPGYDGSQGMYLAGTVVAMQALDKGSNVVFDGWSGADSSNGMLGVVTMNSDKTLHALYNDDLNHPVASASAFGTYMSAVGKATVGLLATAVSSYVINFTSAGLLGLVGTIGSGLGSLGVPYAGAVGQIFDNLSSVITGPLDCVGSWGLGNGGSGGNAYTQGAHYGQTGANAANTVTTKGSSALSYLGTKLDSIKTFTDANAGTLSDAQKTTYALKWVALGVQVGMQLSTATVSADWSMSSFEDQMSTCLSNKGSNLSNSVTGI